MRIAITGASGFVGRHLARTLADDGHQLVLTARGVDQRDTSIRQLGNVRWVPVGIGNEEGLSQAFEGCQAVAHCAGINREIGEQTYRQVHVEGTRNVVEAAKRAKLSTIVLVSFLRARPGCGSGYHESKWQAEEIVRSSGLDYTVLKPAMIYGTGDHMLDHLSHALHTFPAFALIGKDRPVCPVAVEDIAHILKAALVEGRLRNQTVAVMGPELLPFSAVVRRVAAVVRKRPLVFPLPATLHYLLARCFERVMAIPLISTAQVQMLAEGMEEPLPFADPLPDDLAPRTRLTSEQIRRGLPPGKPFGIDDLRCRWKRSSPVMVTR